MALGKARQAIADLDKVLQIKPDFYPARLQRGNIYFKQAKLDDVKGVEVCEPQSPSEDFAFYAKTLPSTFIYSGAKPREGKAYPHHHPKFTIDESSMLVAAEAVGAVVLNYLTIE